MLAVGGFMLAFVVWAVTAFALEQLLALATVLYPRVRVFALIHRAARRFAPSGSQASRNLIGQAGCLVWIGAAIVILTEGAFQYPSLWVLPALAVLWAAGLAALSIRESLDRAAAGPPQGTAAEPRPRLADALRSGCVRDLAAVAILAAVLVGIWGLCLALLAVLAMFAGPVPPDGQFQGPEYEMPTDDERKPPPARPGRRR